MVGHISLLWGVHYGLEQFFEHVIKNILSVHSLCSTLCFWLWFLTSWQRMCLCVLSKMRSCGMNWTSTSSGNSGYTLEFGPQELNAWEPSPELRHHFFLCVSDSCVNVTCIYLPSGWSNQDEFVIWVFFFLLNCKLPLASGLKRFLLVFLCSWELVY